MKQRQFLVVTDGDEARAALEAALPDGWDDLGTETVPLGLALGRVLADDITSAVDVPGFDRANLDGWAVRAIDTYGATEAAPVRLRRHPEPVAIGHPPSKPLAEGEAMSVPTGGALPRGADAVVMVEYTDVEGDEVVLWRAQVPGGAITYAGTDLCRGETLYRRGDVLTSREIGVLAACGHAEVSVRRQPRVAILSTGDELVAPGADLTTAQLFDANGPMLEAAITEHGARPIPMGILPDDPAAIVDGLRRALALADVVLFSGGTSKGPGDLNVAALSEHLAAPGVVVHGVALKPGKPLCLAAHGRQPVVVLPGYPTSAIFTFHEFVVPLLRRMAGLPAASLPSVSARVPRRLRSDAGRTEYSLVHLVRDDTGTLLAYPVGKGSGSVTTWSRADGYFRIPRRTEQVAEGTGVEVIAVGGEEPRPVDLVVIGSHCVGLDVLVTALRHRGVSVKMVAVGSEAGIVAARRGACDVAPVHLMDPESGTYNRHLLGDDLTLIEGYGRRQGLVSRNDDARFSGDDAASVVASIAANDPEARLVNRQVGAGTRILIDRLLGAARPPGYAVEASSHQAVAAAIAQGRADFGVAIDVVARDYGLAFLPYAEERFDFAVPRRRRDKPGVAALVEVLGDEAVRAQLRERGFIA